MAVVMVLVGPLALPTDAWSHLEPTQDPGPAVWSVLPYPRRQPGVHTFAL
jgi:hypothetical protein